ncbi:MAG: hypothetical protein WDZ52_02495 [Pseudohongiellaceae bacterium]
MKNIYPFGASLILFAALSFAFSLAVAQSPVPPASYFKAEDIQQALQRSAAERPGMAVGNIQNGDDFRINLIRRTEAAGAIVHEVGTELHYITEGAGILVTGGVINRPADGGRATIIGGHSQRVTVGDAVLVPVGTPHWYTSVETSITYLEVRF